MTDTVYLTVPEAAERARCSHKMIRRAFERGELEAFRPAHKVLIRADHLQAWIEAKAAAQTERKRPRQPAPRARRPAPASVTQLREIERELTR